MAPSANTNENPFVALANERTEGPRLEAGPRPSLTERFSENAAAAFRHGTTTGAAAYSFAPETRRRLDERYESLPQWETPAEGLAALAGQLVGSAPDIINFIPGMGGAKLAGRMGMAGMRARVAAGAMDAAALNAAADAAIQKIEIMGGARDHFSWQDLAASTALGAAAGGALGPVTHRVSTRAGAAGKHGEKQPATAPGAVAAPPTTMRPEKQVPATGEPPSLGDVLAQEASAARAGPFAGEGEDVRRALARELGLTQKPQPRPESLAEFIARKGGIKPSEHDAGEISSLALDAIRTPGKGAVIRKKDGAMSLAEAAQLAGDAGYIKPSGDAYTASANELLDALEQEAHGKRIYAMSDAAAAATADIARDDIERGLMELDRAIGEVHAELTDALPLALRKRAVELRLTENMDPGDAIERAILEDYHNAGAPEPIRDASGEDIPFPSADERGGAGSKRAQPARQGEGNGRPASGSDNVAHGGASGSPGEVAPRMGETTGSIGATSVQASIGAPAHAPRRDPAAARPENAAAFIRLREVSEKLMDAMGMRAVRQGRIAHAMAQGTHAPGTGAIRLRSLEDFDTFTHEAGHYLEARHKSALATHVTGPYEHIFAAMAYPGAPRNRRASEGFAEFFRLYLTNPAYLERQNQTRTARLAFDEWIVKNEPELHARLMEVRAAYESWRTQPSGQAVSASIVSAKKPGWVRAAFDSLRDNGLADTLAAVAHKAYAFMFDDLHFLNVAVKELQKIHLANTGKHLPLKAIDDPYKLARMSRGAHAAGHMDIMYGVHSHDSLKPTTPSLRDAMIEAMGMKNAFSRWDDGLARDFGAYLWSRRAIGEWERFEAGEIPNPPDKFTKADHEQTVADFEAANPNFATAAQKVHEFARGLWKKKFDAGLISREQYEAGLKIKDYVPGLRDFSHRGDTKVTARKPGRKSQSAKSGFIRRFMGSRRDVINPLESLMADAYATAEAIARNDVAKALDALGQMAGHGSAHVAERIPAHEIKALKVDWMEALEAAASRAGMGKEDYAVLRDQLEGAFGPDEVSIFRPAVINEKGEPIVFFRDGGKLAALRLADGDLGRAMYRAMTGMSAAEKHWLVNLMSKPAAVLRGAITTSMDFLLANLVRDQVMAGILYGTPLRRIGASMRGMADEVMGAEIAQRYNAASGIMGGAATSGLRQGAIKADLRSMRRKGFSGTRLTSLKGLMAVTELSETGTRLGLFRTFYESQRRLGLREHEALLEASYLARDYIDFDRHGSGFAALARVIPFFNAALQGLDKAARHMIVPLARKWIASDASEMTAREAAQAAASWARLMMLGVAGMSLHALMKKNPDYDDVNENVRATHWVIMTGAGKYVAVPKPFEMAVVLNLFEAAWDTLMDRDPLAARRYLDGLHNVIAPPSVITGNPAVKAVIEMMTNTDLHTGTPIVPEHLRGLEPWLQYTAHTSAFGKALGKAANVSPAMIDHVITSFGASWGRSLLALSDWASPDKPLPGWDDAPILRRFIKDASRGSNSARAFWDLMGRKNGEIYNMARSYKMMMEAGAIADAQKLLARANDVERSYVVATSMAAKLRRLHPLERARDAVLTISALRREIGAQETYEDARGRDRTLSRTARRAADDILSKWMMAEARNALVLSGVHGWEMRRPIDTMELAGQLKAVDKHLYAALAERFARKHVYAFAKITKLWPQVRQRLLDDGSRARLAGIAAQAAAGGYELGRYRARKLRHKKPQVPGKGG